MEQPDRIPNNESLNINKYFLLNIEKIIQVFYYIQKHSRTSSKLELIKYLFFADRIHIRNFYSLISLDIYKAMKHGPVASTSLDVLNQNIEYLVNYKDDDLIYLENIEIIDIRNRKIKEVAIDLLSKNEMNSLDQAINLFSEKDLVDISHDYPEWKRFKSFFESNQVSPKTKPIEMEDFFKNPDLNDSPAITKYFNGKDPLYKDEDYLEEARQFYMENVSQYAK
jgi:uncharacterized phage-associated protein